MNELIEVKTKEDVQVVSARDLHEVLGVKTRFSLWVKQNFKHFRDGIDFTSVVTTTEVQNNGGVQARDLQDYVLTIETAKHIARNRILKQYTVADIVATDDWSLEQSLDTAWNRAKLMSSLERLDEEKDAIARG